MARLAIPRTDTPSGAGILSKPTSRPEEFRQKYFSASARPFAVKYSRTIRQHEGYVVPRISEHCTRSGTSGPSGSDEKNESSKQEGYGVAVQARRQLIECSRNWGLRTREDNRALAAIAQKYLARWRKRTHNTATAQLLANRV
jgi:hypothetical protein